MKIIYDFRAYHETKEENIVKRKLFLKLKYKDKKKMLSKKKTLENSGYKVVIKEIHIK